MKARSVFKVLALIGVPVTAYLSSRGSGIKAERIKNHGKPVTRRDKLSDHMLAYWPAYISGIVTCSSIMMSDHFAGKEIAAATALASAAMAKKDVIKKEFDKYRGVVKEDQGDEKDLEYMKRASEVKLDDEGEVIHHFKINWMDKPIIFEATMSKVKDALNNVNRELLDYNTGSGTVSVSDFLGYLGQGHLATKDTDKAGWNYELLAVDCECYWLDFYVYPEGESIIAHGDERTDTFVIDTPWAPYYDVAQEIKMAEAIGTI